MIAKGIKFVVTAATGAADQALEKTKKKLSELGGAASTVVKKDLEELNKKVAGFGTLAAGAGILALTQQTLEYGRALDQLSAQSGLTSTQIQRLGQLTAANGIDQEEAVEVIIALNGVLAEAANGAEDMEKAFTDLGLDVDDMLAKSNAERLKAFIENFDDTNPKKMEAAIRIAGESAVKFLNAASGITDELDGTDAAFDKAAASASRFSAEISKAAGDGKAKLLELGVGGMEALGATATRFGAFLLHPVGRMQALVSTLRGDGPRMIGDMESEIDRVAAELQAMTSGDRNLLAQSELMARESRKKEIAQNEALQALMQEGSTLAEALDLREAIVDQQRKAADAEEHAAEASAEQLENLKRVQNEIDLLIQKINSGSLSGRGLQAAEKELEELVKRRGAAIKALDDRTKAEAAAYIKAESDRQKAALDAQTKINDKAREELAIRRDILKTAADAIQDFRDDQELAKTGRDPRNARMRESFSDAYRAGDIDKLGKMLPEVLRNLDALKTGNAFTDAGFEVQIKNAIRMIEREAEKQKADAAGEKKRAMDELTRKAAGLTTTPAAVTQATVANTLAPGQLPAAQQAGAQQAVLAQSTWHSQMLAETQEIRRAVNSLRSKPFTGY